MPTISIIAFRGYTDYREEHLLVQFGHVGIQFEGETTIYGFWPTEEEVARYAGNIQGLIDDLAKHEAFIGRLHDDTEIFNRVTELTPILASDLDATHLEVWEWVIFFEETKYHDIMLVVKAWYTDRKTFTYCLPPRLGTSVTEPCENSMNCATFPKCLDIPIPMETGLLRKYVKAIAQHPNGRK